MRKLKIAKHVTYEQFQTGAIDDPKSVEAILSVCLTYTRLRYKPIVSIIHSRIDEDDGPYQSFHDVWNAVLTGYEFGEPFRLLKQGTEVIEKIYDDWYSKQIEKINDYLGKKFVDNIVTDKEDKRYLDERIVKLFNIFEDILFSYKYIMAMGHPDKDDLPNADKENKVFYYYPFDVIDTITEAIFKHDFKITKDHPFLSYQTIENVLTMIKEYNAVKSKYMQIPDVSGFI